MRVFTRLRQGKTEAETGIQFFWDYEVWPFRNLSFSLKQDLGGPESDKPRQSNDSSKLESTDPTSMKLTFLEVDAMGAENAKFCKIHPMRRL